MNAADRARLNDMLDMARRILRLTDGKNRQDLDENDMLLGLAVIRALEVIGDLPGCYKNGSFFRGLAHHLAQA